MDYLHWPQTPFYYYLVDFALMLLMVVAIRWLGNRFIALDKQLAKEDNFAVGIALSGAMIGLALMLMGASSGQAAPSLGAEALYMTLYGLLGMGLMALTRKIFDISLPKISIQKEIQQHNVAAALVDAGNTIAVAMIIRAVMLWVDDDSAWGLLWVLAGFVASQGLMYLITHYRRWLFCRRHDHDLQQQIQNGNIAVAIRFAGHRLGVALAITVTSNLVVYQPTAWIFMVWIALALALFIAQTGVSFVIRWLFLSHIDVNNEIVNQQNIALGTLQAAIYFTVGLLFVGLLG
jgi:uncharacterized membrane protein YjfL (UPF0719 family)